MREKLAFIHVMKTAGSHVTRYLEEEVFARRRLRFRRWRVLNSWREGRERDWTEDELRGFLGLRARRVFVHNHAAGWTSDLVREYRAAGFFTFTYVRHPGDAICSFYRWSEAKDGPRHVSLDTFVRRQMDRSRGWDTLTWWADLDYAAEYTDEAFARFLDQHLGHVYRPTPRVNTSANQGYTWYRESGEISDETHAIVEASRQMAIYREIVRARS